jgi:predicted transposase YbfD/YdcC
VLQVTRIRKSGEQQTQTVQSYISSLPPDAENLSQRVREHWGIENSQHYVLDVTFTEDASRIRKGSAPEISWTLRRFALNILQSDKTLKESIRGKRKMCGWDDDTFSRLLVNA